VFELNLKIGDSLYMNFGGALATLLASTQGGSAPITLFRSGSTAIAPISSTSESISINKSNSSWFIKF